MRSFSRRTDSFDNFNKRLAYDNTSDGHEPDMVRYNSNNANTAYMHINHNNKQRHGADDFDKVKSHSQPNSPTENEERSAYRQINRDNKTKSYNTKF